MDDVMTVFGNAPRAGCPAPDVIKSALWVAFVIPVQWYVRGRPNRTMPVFQTKHLQELQWITSKDMILVGCGHDPSVVQAGQTKLRQFEAIKFLPVASIGASCSGEVQNKALRRVCNGGFWTRLPIHGCSPLHVADKAGGPKR